MEVHGRQPGGDLPREQYVERREELSEARSDKVREAREMLANLSRQRQERLREAREAHQAERTETVERSQEERAEKLRTERRADVLDVSTEAREVTAEDEGRAQHVQELRAEHEAGTLNTPERVEQAAQRMLEG
jgi:hypothetical protein